MKLWSLYNEEEKLRIDDLTAQQVKIIMLAISSRRMQEWYACPQGKMAWLPLAEVEEFHQNSIETETVEVPLQKASGGGYSAPVNTSRPEPKPTPTKSKPKLAAVETVEIDNRSSPTLMVDLTQTKERRSARRYARKWRFKCTINDQIFTCETVDVSVTGIKINTALPQWVPKVFKAEITLGMYSIEILCERVSSKKIKISGTENLDLLRRWIVNF